MSAARRRSEASEVLEPYSAGAYREARFPRRIRHESRDESHPCVGQTRLRIHRARANELGKEPDRSRRDPIVRLGRAHHDVRNSQQATIRSMAEDGAPAQASSERRAGDGQPRRAPRPARCCGVLVSPGAAHVHAAVLARSEPNRARMGVAKAVRSATRASTPGGASAGRPTRPLLRHPTSLPRLVRTCRLFGSIQVISGVRGVGPMLKAAATARRRGRPPSRDERIEAGVRFRPDRAACDRPRRRRARTGIDRRSRRGCLLGECP